MVQAVVVIGGGALSTRAIDAIRPDAVVIAADSGLDHAVAAGLRPAVLVGDLDSISASGRMWALDKPHPNRGFSSRQDLSAATNVLAGYT